MISKVRIDDIAAIGGSWIKELAAHRTNSAPMLNNSSSEHPEETPKQSESMESKDWAFTLEFRSGT